MDALDLHRVLRDSPWRRLFGVNAMQRAERYVRQGRVVGLAFVGYGDGGLLEAKVRGKARSPYVCEIAIDRAATGHEIDGRCSCPMARNCKHVAAALIVAERYSPAHWPGGVVPTASSPATAQNPDRQVASRRSSPSRRPSAEPAWRRWLQSLGGPEESPDPADRRDADHAARLFVLLVRDARTEMRIGELQVSPVWLRRGVNKPWVSPQSVVLHPQGPDPAPPEGWDDEETDALTVLLGSGFTQRTGAINWYGVKAPARERAWMRLVRRRPMYLERVEGAALALGPSRALALRWQEDDDGSQRLVVDAAHDNGDDVRLLQGARLWSLLRGETPVLGPLDGDPRLLDAARHAPVLAVDEVADFNREIEAGRISLPLPRAHDRGAPVVIDCAPVPVLKLRPVTIRTLADLWRSTPATATEAGAARLRFDYGGVELARGTEPRSRQLRGERLIEVRRRLAVEGEVADILHHRGLVHPDRYGDELVSLGSAAAGSSRSFAPDELILRTGQGRFAAPDAWGPLLDELEALGFRLDYADDFPHRRWAEVGDWHADAETGASPWFDLKLGIDIDGERVDLLPILRRVLADPRFPLRPVPGSEREDATWRVDLDEKRRIALPMARLRELITPLLEWLEGEGRDGLRLHRSQAEQVLSGLGTLHWRGDEALRRHIEQLTRAAKAAATLPRTFKGELRPYQRDGLAWLNFLDAAGLGGVLADDMGLGKTVQVLAHLATLKQSRRLREPVLIVCPTSLVGNWRDEAARFAPGLRSLVLHGADRADRYDEIDGHQLVITTYPLLPRDRERLLGRRFSLLVLDEAQAIKNARSQAAQVVREIDAGRRLAMTGTPLENHLGELWAQFDAVEPGLLGGEREFARLYRTPIEKRGDGERQARLNRRIGPLLLRRRKEDVLADLPAKSEIVRRLELAGDQRTLYETLRLAQHERVREAVAQRGLAQAGIVVLDALLKLRQACCDPRLVKLPSARKHRTSVKLDALLELLTALVDEGRRILVFSQFAEMLALIETALDKAGIAHQVLTGATPGAARSGLVRRFQAGEVPVFLISLKAGGVGLNLTAADTVVHYDPWWNPAVEAQATDRAHRIGQDKPVFVYKLICAGTVEEKIQALQARKAELARAVLEGGSSQRLRFDESDLEALFAPM